MLRHPARCLSLLAWLGLADCAPVIGADFDRKAFPSEDASSQLDSSSEKNAQRPEVGQEPSPDGDAAAVDDSAADDTSVTDSKAEGGLPDAVTDHQEPVPFAQCGDMRGLQPGSPWPMGGYCNGRPSRSSALAPSSPLIAWRYTLKADLLTAAFISPPVIAADGTIYALANDSPEVGTLHYSLVALRKDGSEHFNVAVAAEGACLPHASPAIAADGTVYVSGLNFVSAWNPDGSQKWSQPLGFYAGTAPVVLPDGTVVVSSSSTLVAFRPDGSKRWELAPDGYAFGRVAVLADGLLVVAEDAKFGSIQGAIRLISPEGQARLSIPLQGNVDAGPSVDDQGRIVVHTKLGMFYVVTELGFIDVATKGPSLGDFPPDPAIDQTRAWFGGGAAVSLNLHTGAVETLADMESVTSGFLIAGDGSLIVGTRSGYDATLRGLEPDGTERWRVALEANGNAPEPPVLGADGTIYFAWGPTLYAVRD